MASFGYEFNVDELPQSTSNFDPLPAGWYTATISKAELRKTNDGTGEYIAVRYDITGPTHQGRVVFGNLNIKNKSSQAEEIGRTALGEIMRGIGLARVTDTDQLIGGSLAIKLNVKEARTDSATGKQYEASNEVKGFKAIGGSAAPAPAFAAKAAPAAAPAKAAPPWAKK